MDGSGTAPTGRVCHWWIIEGEAMKQSIQIEMPHGEIWDVPVMAVARDRATHFADEYDGDVERSLREETLPLFEYSDYEILSWAENNMNWFDVKEFAVKIKDVPPLTERDFQEGWTNGNKVLVCL
jgi:hypothetical protein